MSLEDDKREAGLAVPDPTDVIEPVTMGSLEDIPDPSDSSPEILEIPSAETPEKESSPKIPPTPPPSANPSNVSLINTSKLEEEEEEDDDDEDFEDETILERIVALSEMFPPGIVNGTSNVCSFSINTAKWLFSTSKMVSWAVFSSIGITLLPIIIESERSRIVEAEKQQQRQILLGPGAAVSGSM